MSPLTAVDIELCGISETKRTKIKARCDDLGGVHKRDADTRSPVDVKLRSLDWARGITPEKPHWTTQRN
jgi:hypothetical protein